MKPLAVSLDLGSTRIKAGVMTAGGELVDVCAAAAPPLVGEGLIRECDATAYMGAAQELLARTLRHLPEDIPLGIASQRSSFLLWNAKSGRPVTPMISWQDRRAHEWCRTHAHYNKRLVRHTGLLLSPHYAAPKLACLLAADETLRRAANAGELLFGTLETYFVWRATRGRVHTTDLTMAARTLLANPRRGNWSPSWLKAFGIPRKLLPRVVPTWGRKVVLDTGAVVTATVTDQAAGVIALMQGHGVLVNLGTGGFVTLRTGDTMRLVKGFLSGPLMLAPAGGIQYSLEGTINGIGTTLSQAPGATIEPGEKDLLPGVFCSPDSTGIGAPFWRADLPLMLSCPETSLSPVEYRRAILEGIVFRIAGIARALCGRRLPDSFLVSGGLAAERFLAQGIASCLQHPVQVSGEKETTLLGAARLAAGAAVETAVEAGIDTTPPPGERVQPERASYLPQKFLQWQAWMDRMLAG